MRHKRATCSVCERNVPLTGNGLVMYHLNIDKNRPSGRIRCMGYQKPPKEKQQ